MTGALHLLPVSSALRLPMTGALHLPPVSSALRLPMTGTVSRAVLHVRVAVPRLPLTPVMLEMAELVLRHLIFFVAFLHRKNVR